ncbi:SusC/RagA family TonB-linked outer membrane protein [Marinifilum sp. N1E240]|uniref:SusC/RagA family TonB-linked outer membrane protein n=1 Tax=Marinifilum sp. N1E240 TaxID=2608082 RepID=UPI00128BE49C|nr:TonB-dependent receptor [Marinifilum sp. N1E240]MPQ47479.1 SusC/RagA family TonB-linked outer membrane protein [Marinifilum sp. N1E240]
MLMTHVKKSCKGLRHILSAALVLVLFAATAVAQNGDKRTITGTVTDAKTGETIIGANLWIKGTTVGTTTNFDGNYTIESENESDVLAVSFIGYQTQEVIIAKQTTINFNLEADTESLDEVVVVAYGTQKKSNLTGSVASVKADKLKDVTTPRVENLLQGKASGVYVSTASGQPGSKAKIRIRGKGSLSSEVDPLWVVDGVVGADGSSISPNEIENISILKDASATALYGSRGANGVIIVTTKTAKKGREVLSVNANYGVNILSLGNFEVMNSQELYDYHKSWNGKPWFTEKLLETDTDWFDLGTQTGTVQNYNMSYSGTSGKVSTFIMGDYYNETGSVKGYEYDKYTMRVNLDYKVNDKLTLKTKLSGFVKKTDDQQHSVYAMYHYLPWDSPKNLDGSVRKGDEGTASLENSTEGDYWIGRDGSNYMYNLQWNWSRSRQIGGDVNMGFDYKITPFLTFVSTNNYNYKHYFGEHYTDARSTAGESDKGSLENDNRSYTKRFTNQMLKFNKAFGDDHNLTALVGYEFTDYVYERSDAVGKGIPQATEVLGVAAEPKSVDGTKQEWAMESYLFNTNYIFKNRYMAQFSFRRDGSSRFGENKRFGNFFTVSAGWSVHEEDFMQNIEWLNTLKVRTSYGSVGNMPTAYYGSYGLYAIDRHYVGTPAAFPQQLVNNNLTWEKSYMSNFAIDARLFNRLNLSVDIYDKNTSDLLYYVRLASITGVENQWQNVGKLNNRGVEITLNTDIVRGDDFNWDLDFNIGFNKNEIKEMYNGQSQITGKKNYTEGHDMNEWFMREWAGVDQATGAPMWYIHNEDGTKETTTDYASATRELLDKSSAPDFFGGFSTSLSYKNVNLSANFGYAYGNYIYHSARETFDSDGGYPTFNNMKMYDGWSRWEKPGDKATHPKAIEGGNNQAYKPSSRYLEDGSYLKLRNVTLSYNLPESVLTKMKLKSVKFFVTGENLWTLTDFSGTDPEVAVIGDTNDYASRYYSEGTAGALYPMSRKFLFGVNIQF